MESLLEGRWVLPDQQEEGEGGQRQPQPQQEKPEGLQAPAGGALLTAIEAAVALRCLAGAPRLPPLSYAAPCRKLIRTYCTAESGRPQAAADAAQAAAGSAPAATAAGAGAGAARAAHGAAEEGVWEGCISLAAAHGARSPAYQLADFIASDLLAPDRLAALPLRPRCALLRSLGPLLSALPEGQAVRALKAACDLSPDLSNGARGSSAGGSSLGGSLQVHMPPAAGANAAGHGERCRLLAALLEGLVPILAGGDSAGAGAAPGSSPAVRQAALECLATVLLRKLPPPGVFPVNLAALAEAAQGQHQQALLDPGQRCWAAMLRCLLQLPRPQLLQLLLPPPRAVAAPQAAAAGPASPLQLSYAAALLVAAGAVDGQALQLGRNLILADSSSQHQRPQPLFAAPPALLPTAEGAVAVADMAALLAGRAVALLPLAAQQQWLADTLDAVQVRALPPAVLLPFSCRL